jgi:hypothetical protein
MRPWPRPRKPPPHPAALDDSTDRVNITLPRRVLRRLDALAKANGETRSGYIAQLTLAAPSRLLR